MNHGRHLPIHASPALVMRLQPSALHASAALLLRLQASCSPTMRTPAPRFSSARGRIERLAHNRD